MTTDVNGIRVFYEQEGEGEDIVLLHGWGASAASFRPLFDYLSKRSRTLALDFPGFGNSDTPSEVWGVKEYGEFLLSFFDAIKLKSVRLIAHSFGGRVAIWIAAHFPERVSKIILVNSAGIKPSRGLTYYLKTGTAKTGRFILKRRILGAFGEDVLSRLYSLLGSKDYKSQHGIMRSILVKVVNEDLKELLPKISVPVLLIWGENDTDVPVKYAREMERRIKDSGLVVLKDAGHYSYLDKFHEFCIIVSNFFSLSEGEAAVG